MSLRASITRLLATNVGLLLVSVAIIPLLTRVVSPADWGQYQLLVNLAVMGGSVMFLKLDAAYVVETLARRRRWIAGAVLGLGIGTGLVFMAVMVALVALSDRYTGWSLLAVGGALLLSFYQMRQIMQAAHGDYQGYSRTKVFVQLSQQLTLLGAAFLGAHYGWLFVAWLLPLLPLAVAFVRTNFRGLRLDRLRVTLVRQRSYVLFNAPSSLVHNFRQTLPLLLLFAVAPAHEYGLLMMALRLLDLPISVGGVALQHVLYPEISRLWGSDRVQARRLYFTWLLRLGGLAVTMAVVLLLLPDGLYVLVMGQQWSGMRELMLLAACWKLMEFVATPLAPVSNLLAIQGRVALLRVVFLLLSVGLVWWLGKDFAGAALLVVACSFFYYLLSVLLNYHYMSRQVR